MLEAILLGLGIVYMFRKPKLRKLDPKNFPTVDPKKFEEWRTAEIKALNVFLWATWGALVVKIILNVVLQMIGIDALTAMLIVVGLWLIALIYPAILGSRAKKLLKELGIKYPTKI